MENESPGRGGAIVSKSLVGLLAAMALAVLVLAPNAASAHEGEKHSATKAEAQVPAEPDPVESAVESGSAHPYPPEGVPRPLAWLGKLHPALTHFPIALLSVAALAECLLLFRPREIFRHAVRFCVWGGAIGALVAAPLGWFFAGFRVVDDEWVMTAHRWVGSGTALWALLVVFLVERIQQDGSNRSPFRLALFTGALLVSAAGFLGGSLIYGLGHYAWE